MAEDNWSTKTAKDITRKEGLRRSNVPLADHIDNSESPVAVDAGERINERFAAARHETQASSTPP